MTDEDARARIRDATSTEGVRDLLEAVDAVRAYRDGSPPWNWSSMRGVWLSGVIAACEGRAHDRLASDAAVFDMEKIVDSLRVQLHECQAQMLVLLDERNEARADAKR